MCARETFVGFPLRVQSKAANGGPDFCKAKISRHQKRATLKGWLSFGAPSGIRTPDTLLKRRKPVRKAQYIVAIKRYSAVFIGVFLAKMLRYTAPYRLGYYQITITFRAIFTHCDTCFGSSLHHLLCRFASRADNHR